MSTCSSVLPCDLEKIKNEGAELLEKFGYLIIQNVFTEDEARAYREILDRLGIANYEQFNDLMSTDELRGLMLDEVQRLDVDR